MGKLVITGPTHHTSSRSTWIDLLLVNQCETVKGSNRVTPPILSRHDIISVTITKYSPTTPPPTVSYRNLAKVVPQDLASYLQNCDWSLIALSVEKFDLDQGLSTLTDSVHGAIDHLAPEKTYTC